jgi:hypothetical protein
MDDKDKFFILFSIFNIIFGLCGIGLTVSAIILIIRLNFNPLDFILIAIGVIMLLIMILGLNIKKKYELSVIYLIFIMIHILLYVFMSIMFLFLTEKLIAFLDDKLSINDNDSYLNYIEEYHVILFIISGSLSLLCVITFIVGVIYCKKMKMKKNKENKVQKESDDILKGLDYSMPLDSSLRTE